MEEMGGWDGLSRRSRMRYSCLATAASSFSGGALIPDCTRAPAQVCPLLINDV